MDAPKPRLLIDADACPVKAEAERVATRFGIEMMVVSNGGLRPSPNPLLHNIYVPAGADEADKWIADACTPRDVVVTSDIPLAAKCLAKDAQVIKHNGELLTRANIGMVLAQRDLMADLRAADPFRAGGGRPFSKADRARFLDNLDRLLHAALRRN
ncbi:MAG: YaiI/YqxD family protein [Cypionkella sp.]|nr:YaiI/YqxD family protein [Cypionkella sp.]